MNGIGVYSWPDGKMYIGEYVDNFKQGYGIFKLENGNIHSGYWKKGKGNGPGTY